ncbi:MAG: HD-GYP domain-containing protein [Rhodocyclaceae bacterium]|jgi:putative nucleotidyltransferase with HDIG domain|nr:HD-GYP domain-containing protein [Rhodocyclaceae bacterium]
MLKKIAVGQLKLGMHIHEFCGSWMDHPFWRTKFILKDPEDLRQIRACGVKEIWIDAQKGIDVAGPGKQEAEAQIDTALQQIEEPPPQPSAAQSPKVQPTSRKEVPRVPIAEEVQRAAKICAKSKDAVVSMFNEVRMGKAVDAAAVNELVDEISSSVMRNPGALISLARLKTADDYTYMHSVAVCALMVALSRQLELDEADTRSAAMAGLLHDLGKAVMPMEVLNKPGKLTDDEFRIIKSHPVEGHRMLLEGSTAGEIVLDVCLHHHEKVDGSGYPKGLKEAEISLHAKMGAVCDVYDAITSNRPYKAGWDPAESIRKMAEWSKGHFNERVFQAFVKSIGIYPTGSLVRLSSDRLAVVVEQSPASLLAPTVKAFYSAKSQTFLAPELIDLSRPGTKEKIVSREDAAQWGIKDIDRLWAE